MDEYTHLVYDGNLGVVAVFTAWEKANAWIAANTANSIYGLRCETKPVNVNFEYKPKQRPVY
jgi:hypothetical protein